VRTFAEENPFPYPVLYDTEDAIATQAEIYALPTVMVVDRSGNLSYLQSGLSDVPTLREALESAAL
jgi:peroxiredoxin